MTPGNVGFMPSFLFLSFFLSYSLFFFYLRDCHAAGPPTEWPQSGGGRTGVLCSCWEAVPGGRLRKPKESADDVSQTGDLGVGPDLRSEQDQCPGPSQVQAARCSGDRRLPPHSRWV